MSACRVLVLISGNGSNLQAIIDQAQPKGSYEVIGVISNNADAYGLQRAHAHGIATQTVLADTGESRASYDQRLQAAISHFQPDLIVLAGFMRILSDALVQAYCGRMINVHPSLLPKFPGLHTHAKALAAGEQEHGASIHFVVPALDAGPVILQAKVPVFEDDTPQSLAERVHEQEHAIYPLVVKWFANGRLKMQEGQAWLDGEPLTLSGYATE